MEPDSKKQERTIKMQSKVLEYLADSGNISYACKRAGVNRDTFYTWKKEDKLFAENAELAMDYGNRYVNDLAHTQLIKLIQEGNMQAVRFQLLSRHDDYKPRRALPPEEPEEEQPRPVEVIYIRDAPERRPRLPSPSPSPAPSTESPKEEKETPPASPAAKPEPPPEKENEVEPPHPLRWRGWDDDDGFDVDSSWIWGKR